MIRKMIPNNNQEEDPRDPQRKKRQEKKRQTRRQKRGFALLRVTRGTGLSLTFHPTTDAKAEAVQVGKQSFELHLWESGVIERQLEVCCTCESFCDSWSQSGERDRG